MLLFGEKKGKKDNYKWQMMLITNDSDMFYK